MTIRHRQAPESYPPVAVRSRENREEQAAAWEWVRRIAQTVQGVMLGRTNNTFAFSLDDGGGGGATTTTLSNDRFTADTALLLVPLTANAAAILGNAAGVYQTASAGQIVLTHANNTNADADFLGIYVG